MDEMSFLFRNTVSKANDLVYNGMRDRYASLLDENDEDHMQQLLKGVCQ